MHRGLKSLPVNSSIFCTIFDFDFFLSRFKETQHHGNKATMQRSLELICKYLITPNHRKPANSALKEYSKPKRVTSNKSNRLEELTF